MTDRHSLIPLELNYLVSSLGVAMAGSFGILFLFKLGGSLSRGLLFVVLFYFFQRLLAVVLVPLISFFMNRWGYRRLMIIGLFAISAKLFLLSQAAAISSSAGGVFVLYPLSLTILFLAAVLGSFYLSAYDLGYQAIFIDDHDNRHLAEQAGWLILVGRLAEIAAPIAAGGLVDLFNFSTMFLIAMGIVISSSLPLILMRHHHRHYHSYQFKEAISFIKNYPALSLSVIGWHISDSTLSFFWPIYMLIVLKSYTLFGAASSLILLANAFVVYAAGRYWDGRAAYNNYKNYKFYNRYNLPFLLSALSASFFWFLRFFTILPIFVVGADVFGRMSIPFWWMKIRRAALERGEKVDGLVFASAWEILITIGYLIGILTCYWLLITFSFNWLWLLVPAIGGILLGTIFQFFQLPHK